MLRFRYIESVTMQYQAEILIPLFAMLSGVAIPISVFIWLYYDAKGKRETVLEIAKHLGDASKLDELINLFEERKEGAHRLPKKWSHCHFCWHRTLCVGCHSHRSNP